MAQASHRRSSGRLASLGQDYARGHKSYVENLTPGGRLWLRTKPFFAPPPDELMLCLRTFAHIVERLSLGLRAQVLDVGCGPGWMSEFFARCGYWVTGIDISEDMVEIARSRIKSIEGPIGEGTEKPMAEFYAMPVRDMPWHDRFDAAVLYDTMHHFDDELATLQVIRRALVPGGRIYIREGARPAPGSEGEQQLIREMEEYGTLESPFDPEYLAQVVRDAGFVDVRRFIEIDELLDIGDTRGLLARLRRYVAYRLGRNEPESNTLIATKPIPIDQGAESFSAELQADVGWRASDNGQTLSLLLRVRNTGRSFWPAGGTAKGVVTLGPYVPQPGGERLELPRTLLPHALAPGEELQIELCVPRVSVGDSREVAVDCVREGIAWFADMGSAPLVAAVE
ncbi:MAG: methyltransferase domain-containing protein [Actinobacteria bacterium]|nr:MAG: methyltransferase domain-containing protein [Actinomycetota bacterium]